MSVTNVDGMLLAAGSSQLRLCCSPRSSLWSSPGREIVQVPCCRPPCQRRPPAEKGYPIPRLVDKKWLPAPLLSCWYTNNMTLKYEKRSADGAVTMMCVARPIPNVIAKKQNMALVPRLRREYEVSILQLWYRGHSWLACYIQGCARGRPRR